MMALTGQRPARLARCDETRYDSPMLPEGPIRDTLLAYKRRLEARFGERLVSVKLFGSYARGEARPDSDVDVCVVIRDATRQEQDEACGLMVDVCMETRSQVLLSPLIFSEAQFAELRRRELLIAEDIDREGIPL